MHIFKKGIKESILNDFTSKSSNHRKELLTLTIGERDWCYEHTTHLNLPPSLSPVLHYIAGKHVRTWTVIASETAGFFVVVLIVVLLISAMWKHNQYAARQRHNGPNCTLNGMYCARGPVQRLHWYWSHEISKWPLWPLLCAQVTGKWKKRERSCGLVPVCWKGELVQEPHHTDSRLVLRGTRADGARLTLMCDSTQSSRWISAPSTKWPLNSEFAACAFTSYNV